MLTLGIESSCDETAAAVVEDGRKVLSSVVASQADLHAAYGGVVPELASRNHVVKILPVVEEALATAGTTLDRAGGIAVTAGPGLMGSLLVGVMFAKAVAMAKKIPLVGVNHLEGHLCAVRLEERHPEAPYLGLIVSGGHTSLYLVEDLGQYKLVGRTRDDAAGEAFDKVAKLLGLGYPGGPVIDRMARDGDPKAFRFPRAMPKRLEFSFSGLKTAVVNVVRSKGIPEGGRLFDLVASFQEAVADTLASKTLLAANKAGVTDVVVAGGVASNSRIRAVMEDRCAAEGIRAWFAPPALCTDNAAMIAAAGYPRLVRGENHAVDLTANPSLEL
ncbi:MAG: tRNA (adenosine(37)-N6)-threonylcarbamoyltransferase complex transferase subunit TsaD [Deltaproteobacteria bacterium]|nr:tRNA (adenosine(37)-N6)-threonylcarbamoyltransferase complex transferase subunit TsaD [Deltaproteobacteria bacterium]